jgi:hypothetical protein
MSIDTVIMAGSIAIITIMYYDLQWKASLSRRLRDIELYIHDERNRK